MLAPEIMLHQKSCLAALIALAATGAIAQTAGLETTAIRAVANDRGVALTIQVTNTSGDPIRLRRSQQPRIVTNTGATNLTDDVTGTDKNDYTIIDPKGWVIVTMIFFLEGSKFCKVDFSMPLDIIRFKGAQQADEGKVTLGIANVSVEPPCK